MSADEADPPRLDDVVLADLFRAYAEKINTAAEAMIGKAGRPITDLQNAQITVQTYGMVIPTHLSMFRPDDRSPEQRAAARARWQWFQNDRAERRRALWRTLQTVDGPLAPVIDHHSPRPAWIDTDDEYGDAADAKCNGCDSEGYEADWPAWPCSTAVLIASGLGLDTRNLGDVIEVEPT